LYKSTDGGGNWTRMGAIDGFAFGCQCGYDQTLAVDPQDAQRVYVAFQEMFLSTNGGGSFSNITNGKVHWDHHATTFSPPSHWGGGGAPTRLWVGTDGGVHRTDNGGSTWANLNEGIATNLFFSLDIGRGNSTNRGYSFGGTQDTGTIQRQPGYAGKDWHLGVDGDGGRVVVDWSDPKRVYGIDNGIYMITTNGGNSWAFQNAAATGLPACSGSTRACASPIGIDQNDNKVVYAVNGLRLFRSADSGATYTGIQTFTVGATICCAGIWSLATTKADSNVVWVGMADGTVWSTANVASGTNASWTQHIVTGAPTQSGATMPVTALAIDPTNTDRVVVIYGGFTNRNPTNRTKHVFLTTDGGETWTDISGTDGGNPLQNLPDLPLSDVVIDPSTIPHTIIVASDVGVFRTADNGATWQRFGLGLPNVLVSALAIDYTASPALLRAGTYGRSVFELAPASGPLLAVNADLSFGNVGIGQSATRIVQLFNVGTEDLRIANFVRVAGSNAFQIISGPPTPLVLTPGHEVDFTMRFQPSVTGALTATFFINSDDTFTPVYALSASGTGVAPKIAVTGDLNFGLVPRGATATRNVIIQNTGGAPLTLSSVAFTGGSAFEFSVLSPSTPQTLAPGSAVTFIIAFSPPGNSSGGARTGTLRINSTDPATPIVNLAANATIGVPKLTLSGDLNFGTVARGTTATRQIVVNNTGNAPLTVSSVAFESGSDASFTVLGPATPQTIAAGSSLAFTIQFAPPADSAPGVRTGTLRINSDDPATPSVTAPASGNVGVPHLTVSSTALQFGAVPVDDRTNPHTSDQTLKLTNQSSCAGCDLQLLSLPISGAHAGDFTLVAPPALPATIAAGNSLDLIVRFNPSDSGGRAATLTVNSDDPTSPTVTVSLSGTGIIPAITALPNPLIFGPTVYDPICDPLCGATLNETIINSGQAELILDTIRIDGSAMFTTPVAIVPPLRVPPTNSADVPVTFHPTGGPTRKVTGTLYITDTLGPAPTAAPVVAAIPVCGESVGRGIRVIVYDNDGNLVSIADRIKLQSHGLTHPVNEQVQDPALTTIDPPTSCQRIQFHYENHDLQATEVEGNRGSYYILTVDVGNKHLTLSFTLEVNEFKIIIATVQ
jgi:hypothetical protein